jgi:type IV pilus assembly protein PilE
MRSTESASSTTCFNREAGFTLVELMVVVAIVGILAAVATPAYVNYINRVKQSEATSLLLTGRIEMEEFYADNNRYAGTIGCLPSFKGNDGCLANCSTCTVESYKNTSGACDGKGCYTYSLTDNSTATYYKIVATRKIYSYAQPDEVTIESGSQVPTIVNTDALKFSVYQWLFE